MSRQARRGANVTAVALANKIARIAWAVLARDRSYEPDWNRIVAVVGFVAVSEPAQVGCNEGVLIGECFGRSL